MVYSLIYQGYVPLFLKTRRKVSEKSGTGINKRCFFYFFMVQ